MLEMTQSHDSITITHEREKKTTNDVDVDMNWICGTIGTISFSAFIVN